ncbi:hypothetical protein CK203_022539 [Vitis vinifera]|uniref:Uncharacterized protein n=1 Tax=Vitis vinifera TaxID=29760 RepID=A0A438JEK4_VITVI|nr:hypothetical protein CK203_022539 [Vitis vinifera]
MWKPQIHNPSPKNCISSNPGLMLGPLVPEWECLPVELPVGSSLPNFKPGTEIDMSDIQKNLQNLYEYNVMLREKLLAIYASSSGNECVVSDKGSSQGHKIQEFVAGISLGKGVVYLMKEESGLDYSQSLAHGKHSRLKAQGSRLK